MTKQTTGKLNWLEKHLPEGMVVDAAWLSKAGFSTSLRSQYVTAGWLEQPARQVYRRGPRGPLTWQQVVISLQTLLECPLVVGGRSALELHGFAHYLPRSTKEVHLYGRQAAPQWLHRLSIGVTFIVHNTQRLFRHDPIARGLGSLSWNIREGTGASNDPIHSSFTAQPWGQWDWPLTLSTPERAILETLDELPGRETFHQVDQLFEGLTNLSPRRLAKLLADCRSVKVKRLFFFFAARHQHAWLKRLDKKKFDLGKGKRMLVKGGKLDPATQITVPGDLDGLR
jgi:hypothetical protein